MYFRITSRNKIPKLFDKKETDKLNSLITKEECKNIMNSKYTNKKILSALGKKFINIFDYILCVYDSAKFANILNIFNIYEFVYITTRSTNLDINTFTNKRSQSSSPSKSNILKLVNTENPFNILNYNLSSTHSLFFWELAIKYNLITNNHNDIYIISNVSFINDIIDIIRTQYLNDKEINCQTLVLNYLAYDLVKQSFNGQLTKKSGYSSKIKRFDNVTDINSQVELANNLASIKNIDFLYLHFNLAHNYLDNIVLCQYLNSSYLLLILSHIVDKLNVGGNMVLVYSNLIYNININTFTIFASLFNEFYIDTSEANTEKYAYFYLILKDKKKNNPVDYIQQIKNIKNTPVLEFDCNNFFSKDSGLDDYAYIRQFVKENYENIFNQIIFKNTQLKKLRKRVLKSVFSFNQKWFFNAMYMYNKIFEIYNNKKYDNPKIMDKFKKKHKQSNLFECITWARKYNIPLKPEYDFTHFQSSYKTKIYKDLVSYEKVILYKVKKHNMRYQDKDTDTDRVVDIDNSQINFSIDFASLPDMFLVCLKKQYYETHAIDSRDMTIYNQIKAKMYFYNKKINGIICKKYGLHNGYVTQAWLKMTEILHKFDLFDKTARELTTFHMCELPGAFIYALEYFIKTKTSIKKWTWRAQSLKEDASDERNAFGDFAGLVARNPEKYDFGYDNTGDITNYDNIKYYVKKYGQQDFITGDCGLSIFLKKLTYKLTYAMYLMMFGMLKNGGSCVLKRRFPINNNQELFMLYICYTLFDNIYLYKPRVNYQSNEYYLIGVGYKPIDASLYNKLLEYVKTYDLTGLYPYENIDEKFILQIDEAQNLLQDNMNDFIRKKIYFVDNFTKLDERDWIIINEAIKDKIEEWLVDFPLR
jgi:hypothetical protein